MESYIQFSNQSQGRDRILRATQYACALANYLLRNDPSRKDLLVKLRALESAMSSGRKLFRLGNTVNSMELAKRTLLLSDPILCCCLTVSHLSRALYFLCDNLLWARSLGFGSHINKDHWRLNATRFYFISLVMSLTRDVYVMAQLIVQRSRDRQHQQKLHKHLLESPDVACVVIPQLDTMVFLLIECLKSHPSVTLDTAKNVCDLFIPLDRLGIWQTNAGVVSFCGLLSSLLGILSVLKPHLKIKP